MDDRKKADRLSHRLWYWITELVDLIYPDKCGLCGRLLAEEEIGICQSCYEGGTLILSDYCRKCGQSIEENQRYCYDCHHFSHEFEQGHSLFDYAEIKEVIWAIKYRHARWRVVALAELMSWLYAEVIKEWKIEAITFVPQSRLDIGEKGYNPPARIAEILANNWQLPLLKNQLRARHKKKMQKTLNLEERRKNLKNIYYSRGKIPFQRILLVDDVYTTGATIDACSLILKENGAEHVYFLTIASGGFKK